MPEIIFAGPDGRLEGRYTHAKQAGAPLALLLHPDPRYGGSMHNKVIYALHQSFVRRGFSTMRFNFRGVGRSQGEFDQGEGELSDAASALDWLQTHNPNATMCWVAGFSFGAWIAMQLLMRRPEISGFVSIAPPANLYDFSFLAPCPSSGLIVHGDQDELVPLVEVAKLTEKLSRQRGITIDVQVIPGAAHLFNGFVEQVVGRVDNYLDRVSAPKVAAV